MSQNNTMLQITLRVMAQGMRVMADQLTQIANQMDIKAPPSEPDYNYYRGRHDTPLIPQIVPRLGWNPPEDRAMPAPDEPIPPRD